MMSPEAKLAQAEIRRLRLKMRGFMREANDKTGRSAERGMTLMEVMVSMVILGVVLVALGQGLTLGIRMNTETKNRLTNLGLCKRITESVKSQIEATQAAFDGAKTAPLLSM